MTDRDPHDFHHSFDGSFWLRDPNGSPIAKACAECEAQKRERYRHFLEPHVQHPEGIHR